MTKIAIVTGANKGIGFEIAKQIAESGDIKVILGCRTESLGKEAEANLKALDLNVEFRKLDVSSDASIDAFTASFISEFGKLDILVNNAAVLIDTVPYGTPGFGATAKPTFKVNYFGLLRLTDSLFPLLRQAPHPRVVNVASGLGHLTFLPSDAERNTISDESLSISDLTALVEKFTEDVETTNTTPIAAEIATKIGFVPAENSIYAYSKTVVIATTKILARNGDNKRVLINACCPGFCDTDMSNHLGTRTPADGAKNASHLALLPTESTYTGRFYENEADSEW